MTFRPAAVMFTLTIPLAAASSTPARAQTAAPPPSPLAFEEALRQLHDQNETIRASDLLVEQRRQERAAAKGLLWPTVTLGAAGVQLSSPIEARFSLEPLAALLPIQLPPLPTIEIELQQSRFAQSSLTGRWLLYSGGKVQAATAAAGPRVDEAIAEDRRTRESTETMLVRFYFGAQLQARARDVRAEALKALDTLAYNAKRLEEEGIIARTERLSADVARADGDRQLKAAESDVELARIALASLLTLDDVGPLTTPLFISEDLPPVEAFVTSMRERHPALAQVRAQQALAAEALNGARGAYKPDVFLFGRQTLAKVGLGDLLPRGAYGIGATFTVFDGPTRKKRVAAADLQTQRAAQLGSRAERDLATLVRQKYRELLKARDQYHTLATALDLAQENVRARTRAFDEGLATTLEVVDARVQLSRIQTERVAAAYAAIVALAELLEASGQSDQFEQHRLQGKEVGAP